MTWTPRNLAESSSPLRIAESEAMKYLAKLGARLELIAVFDAEEERAVPIHIGGTAS